jgi:transglutaminase-like putative cysteine protease
LKGNFSITSILQKQLTLRAWKGQGGMTEYYTIEYVAENTYEHPVLEANWQFLIVPQENAHQQRIQIFFENSENAPWEFSRNGFDFTTIRVRCQGAFKTISFRAVFHLEKTEANPFEFDLGKLRGLPENPDELRLFRVRFSRYLKDTPLSRLPHGAKIFDFDPKHHFFENLIGLNSWVFQTLRYTSGATDVDTPLEVVLEKGMGVCQDFTHLFLAIARHHGIPARYVSGYLHQGLGYFGDAQMHAWAEAHLPGIGWVGFDPANNILATTDHIKVAHGRDYSDCAPLKGVFTGMGGNATRHRVQVETQQQ